MKMAIKTTLIVMTTILCLIALGNLESDSSQSETISEVTTFEELKTALNNGETEIVIQGNIRITENITIPLGTTVTISHGSRLLLPFNESDESGHTFGDSKKYPVRAQTSGEDLCTSTMTNNGTIINKGEITVGSVIGASKTFYYQGHTSSYHATIINNNLIESVDGGVLKSYGIIKGTGTINSYSGTSVIEPLIITDFCGGDTLLNLYDSKQAIFNRYSLSNIQCQMNIFEGSKLSTTITMFINDEFYDCIVDFIGSKDSLIHLSKDSVANFTYDPSKYLETNESLNIRRDIGKNTIILQGGATFGAIEATIKDSPLGDITLSMKDKPFSLPYNIDIFLKNGHYLMSNHYRILPGSTLTVAKDASLSVNGTLEIYEGLHDVIFKGIGYPQPELLKAQGFAQMGKLVLNGKLNILNGSTFSGIIEGTEEGASIYVARGAIVSEHKIEYGCDHKYSLLVGKTNNYSVRTSGAKVIIPGGKLAELTPSTTYVLSNCNANDITLYIHNYNEYKISTKIKGEWKEATVTYIRIELPTDQPTIDSELIENTLSEDIQTQRPIITTRTNDSKILLVKYDAIQHIVNRNGSLEWINEKMTITLSEETLAGCTKDLILNIEDHTNNIQKEIAANKSIYCVNIVCNNYNTQLQSGLISYKIKSIIEEKDLEKLQVWHIDENGEIISFRAHYENNTISFEAPLSGCFAISTEDIPIAKLDLTKNDIYLIGGVGAVLTVALFALIYWFKKREGHKPLK